MTPETAALAFLTNLIKQSPFSGKVYLAGGAVRDEVMGTPIKDIDVVVDMKDGGILFAEWVCQHLNIQSDANPVIFPRFGTAKFNFRHQTYNDIDISSVDIESVMTRAEVYDGKTRKPTVTHTSLWKDANRRDFTVNSLFKNLSTGEIVDYTGLGVQDIKDGIIRTPMDPTFIFGEDPLRMLRAIRFAVRFEWIIVYDVIKGLSTMANTLERISKERIQDELNKMLVSKNPDGAMYIMYETGLLSYVLPEIADLHGVGQNKFHDDDVFGHTMKVLRQVPNDLTTRLAALFHDVGKSRTRSVDEDGNVHFYSHEEVGADMAIEALTRLKYPTEMINNVASIVRNHMRLKHAGQNGEKATDKTLRKFQVDIGACLGATLDVMHADNCNHARNVCMPDQITWLRPRIENLKAIAPKIILPINGNDIMKELGLAPGPQIKAYLNAVQEAWFENPNLSREDAFNIIRAFVLSDR